MIPDPEGRVSAKCAAVFRKDHAQTKGLIDAKKSPPVTAGCKFKGGSAIDEALKKVSPIR